MDISSVQNPRVKLLVKLQEQSRERKKTGLFIVEGVREVSLAMQRHFQMDSLYICPEIFKPDARYPVSIEQSNVFEVTQAVYDKMAYRSAVEGVIGVFRMPQRSLNDFQLSANPLILVLEQVEKPGNLGAVFRTADAAKVSAIIVSDPACDLFNPNLIRASLGCAFTVPAFVCSNQEAIYWLKKNNIQIFASTPASTKHYYESDFTKPTAIVMGAEDKGLSNQWLEDVGIPIAIPMLGHIDSLNVSVATAILTFEAVKQRLGMTV